MTFQVEAMRSRWTARNTRTGNTRLGACPALTLLLRRTICSHLRRSRLEKILNVFQRIHLRFFLACGLASCRTSFASSRTAVPDRLLGESGFTLVELAIILVIVGILATLAVPTYRQAVVKAQEAVLKQNLFTLREMLDQYRADKGRFPQSLSDLVAQGYLRAVPLDPLTRSATTWQEIMDEVEEGVLDVHSASTLVATNGIPYNEW